MGSELVVTTKEKDTGIIVGSSMKTCIKHAAAIKKKKSKEKVRDIEDGTDRIIQRTLESMRHPQPCQVNRHLFCMPPLLKSATSSALQTNAI